MPSSHKTKLLGLHSKWCISRFSREFLPHPFGGDQWTIKAPRVVHMLVLKSWCCWVLSVMDLRRMLKLIKRRLSFLPGFFAGNCYHYLSLKVPKLIKPNQKLWENPRGFAPSKRPTTTRWYFADDRGPRWLRLLCRCDLTGIDERWGIGNGGKGWFASCWMWFHFFLNKKDATLR